MYSPQREHDENMLAGRYHAESLLSMSVL